MIFGSNSEHSEWHSEAIPDESERFGTAYTKLSDRYLSHAIELVTVVIVTFTVMDGIPNHSSGWDPEALPNGSGSSSE